jgi:hypothetical protein
MVTGIFATVFFFMFIGFYAVGPGVCVWLALTELMPTRIRANGMAIAMIINQGVSAGIATVFPKWCAATNDNGTVFFFMFIGFYAVGPGVCVWLALTELMPTRIRANGMAIAMIINQGVSAGIATVFPKWCAATNDNGTVFFVLAGFTVIYFITAAFFLPETKGRTLEEVEKYFTTGKMPEKA